MDDIHENEIPESMESISLEFPDLSDQVFVNFDEVNPEDICMSSFQGEPIWRSATLVAPAPAPELIDLDKSLERMARPQLRREGSNSFQAQRLSIQSAPSAPELPILLMDTHFEVELSLPSLIAEINRVVKSLVGLSVSYSNFEWTCVNAMGSSHCKFQLSIFSGFSTGYVVEGNKLRGDFALFLSLYRQIEKELCAVHASVSISATVSSSSSSSSSQSGVVAFDSYSVFTPAPAPVTILSENADSGGIGPIFRMALSKNVETQIEASRTLCDLSAEESMRLFLCEFGGLSVLRELLKSESIWAVYHAAIAVANISDDHNCHQTIIESNVLPILCSFGVENGYQYAEIRVLAVYILANVMTGLAPKVVASMGRTVVDGWLTTITKAPDSDDRMLLHANRARGHLTDLPVC